MPLRPWFASFQRAEEHFVHAEGIGSIFDFRSSSGLLTVLYKLLIFSMTVPQIYFPSSNMKLASAKSETIF